MKKKILALIITILLLIPCFTLNASAIISEKIDGNTYCGISLSEDYKTLYYKEESYTRFNPSWTQWNNATYFNDIKYYSNEIKSVNFDLGANDVIIRATIKLNDGSSISATYIKEDYYLAEHNSLLNFASEYTITFGYPADTTVSLTSKQILGEKVTLLNHEYSFCDSFDVTAQNKDDSYYIDKGELLAINDSFYYVNYQENNMATIPYYIENQDSVMAYKITDAEAISLLENAYNQYNSDAIGFLTGDFTSNIGLVLLFLAFGIMPLAVFIVFLILSLRAKTPAYRKMFRIIYIISATELVVFAITTILLSIFK